MNGNASSSRSRLVPASASTPRAFGPPTAIDRPLLGHARAVHAEFRPFGLEPFLEPVEDGGRAAGRRGDEVAILRQAHRDAVVEHHPVEPEHQPVADRARRRGSTSGSCTSGRGTPGRPARRPRSCRASTRPGRRPRCAPRGTRARRPRPCPRRVRGKYRGRFHWPTFSKTAPRSTCAACIGVRRTGSSSSGPRSSPASAANGTGTNGGRAFVGPCAPSSQPSAAFTISAVIVPLVRPWSIAVPM